MSSLNWGMIQDGGTFESLVHALLFAEDPKTILFGRPGRDSGQDARSVDGLTVFQAKFRNNLNMDGAIKLALEELERIKKYQEHSHANNKHWESVTNWILVANFSINPNDHIKWQKEITLKFQQENLVAQYWDIEKLEGILFTYPEIQEVFFEGENRILVGVKEAYALLNSESISDGSLEKAMLGRESEMQQIVEFIDSSVEKKILPVIGQGGIGKSRLLYESLLTLSERGWRALWALPATMSKSSQWFRLLNGSQKTCVIIDNPEDSGLLKLVVEQLATVERRNWCVIYACRSENTQVLKKFQNNRLFAVPLRLEPLGEEISKRLLKEYLGNDTNEAWLHSIYKLTGGIPGWLCLVSGFAKKRSLTQLPTSADNIAELYVNSCLSTLGESTTQGTGLIMLRWLALWGTLNLELSDEQKSVLQFLENNGVPKNEVRPMLVTLAEARVVRNWGIKKRLFAVQPLIVREYILSNWLLEKSEDYCVNEDGKEIVKQLIDAEIPRADSILHTFCYLSHNRLRDSETYSLLEPIFKEMLGTAMDGSIRQQYRIVELLEKIGSADPESALDVIIAIRENPKESETIEDAFWGAYTYEHTLLLRKLPWLLFQIAEHVSELVIAARFIDEFRCHIALQNATEDKTMERGKGGRELLSRLLCCSRNSNVFIRPAYEVVNQKLTNPAQWPFVGILLDCILNPIREITEWTSAFVLSIRRMAIASDSDEWQHAFNTREKVFDQLEQNTIQPKVRNNLWRIIAKSHHEFHRAVLHGTVTGELRNDYRKLLINDLNRCISILQKSPSVKLSIGEITAARKIWSWYLEYGKDEELKILAQSCENISQASSTWNMHKFFAFKRSEDLVPETQVVVAAFKRSNKVSQIVEFFEEAKQYLNAARGDKKDMADNMRIVDLADSCNELFDPEAVPANILTSFVNSIIQSHEEINPLAWKFSVFLWRRKIFDRKTKNGTIADSLDKLLELTNLPSRLLLQLYSNVHPQNIGQLHKEELDIIYRHEEDFSFYEWFYLLGSFFSIDQENIKRKLEARLDILIAKPIKANHCMLQFIQSTHITALRYQWQKNDIPVAWIIEMISKYGLDGNLLGNYDLEWLRDQASFYLNINQLVSLINSRIEIESKPKPYELFDVLPHDFNINKWCQFDENTPDNLDDFFKFCQLALNKNSFTALYRIPKYIVRINPSGKHVAAFVEHHLGNNPSIHEDSLRHLARLASMYDNSTDPWVLIAQPICEKASSRPRKNRERIYLALSKNETGVISSTPGEVPSYYVKEVETAKMMFDREADDSPLKPYRQWALELAKAMLRDMQERIEEDFND